MRIQGRAIAKRGRPAQSRPHAPGDRDRTPQLFISEAIVNDRAAAVAAGYERGLLCG
jgi:hypothetical protein